MSFLIRSPLWNAVSISNLIISHAGSSGTIVLCLTVVVKYQAVPIFKGPSSRGDQLKNRGPEFSGALLGPLAQSLFSARVPIAPAPHCFYFSMPCPMRQIHDASDIGTTCRQRCRAQSPLPPICKLDMSPLPISLM